MVRIAAATKALKLLPAGPPKSNLELTNAWRRIITVLCIGVVIGAGLLYAADRAYREILIARIETLADAVDGQKAASLRLPETAEGDRNYTYFKAKLASIKRANRDLRFVYMMGRAGQDDIYFLADSEKPGSVGFSPRGEDYPEASGQMREAFDTGRTFIEGPSHDSYGFWLSAIAPLRNEATGQIVALVGIDVPASFYFMLLTIAGGLPVLVAGLISGIIWLRAKGRQRLAQGQHFQAEMVSVASHELRTPLTGLRWTQENLLAQKLTKKQKELVGSMYESTLQLQENIEDILQLASKDVGIADRLHSAPTDLRSIIDSVIKTQQLAADTRRIRIILQGEWPQAIRLDADPMHLKRAFNNLVSNAVKYSADGSEVELVYANDHSCHLVTIIDHGIGIPDSEQARTFKGFYRASNAIGSHTPGTGMGLYMTRNIVTGHGGRLWFTSTTRGDKHGTTIFVQLPKHKTR